MEVRQICSKKLCFINKFLPYLPYMVIYLGPRSDLVPNYIEVDLDSDPVKKFRIHCIHQKYFDREIFSCLLWSVCECCLPLQARGWQLASPHSPWPQLPPIWSISTVSTCVAQGNAWRTETRQLKDAYTPPSNTRSRWAPYGPVCF